MPIINVNAQEGQSSSSSVPILLADSYPKDSELKKDASFLNDLGKWLLTATVVPHMFPVPLLVKHNENLKCEITEHWFVFVLPMCGFWTSRAKKFTYTKFQLDSYFRPEVINGSIHSKWQVLVPMRYFAQILK